MVVFVEGVNVVDESFGEADSFADKKYEFAGYAGKGSAEVEQYGSRQLFRGGFVVGAGFFWFGGRGDWRDYQ